MRRHGVDRVRPQSAVVVVGHLPRLDQVRRNHGHTVAPRHPARHHAALGVDSAAPEVRGDFDAPPEAAALKPVARNV